MASTFGLASGLVLRPDILGQIASDVTGTAPADGASRFCAADPMIASQLRHKASKPLDKFSLLLIL